MSIFDRRYVVRTVCTYTVSVHVRTTVRSSTYYTLTVYVHTYVCKDVVLIYIANMLANMLAATP